MAGFDYTQPYDFDVPDGEVRIGEVCVTETWDESELLGPDGQPLQYDKPKLGFRLIPKGLRE